MSKELTISEINDKLSDVARETGEILKKLPVVTSRLESVLEKPLKLIDIDKMNYIAENSKEINDKMYLFSRRDSKTTRSLMTLPFHFPADSTYRILQQVLAQIEDRQQALRENVLNIKGSQLKIQKLHNKMNETNDEIDKELLMIKIQKQQLGIANSFSYIEAAIKELGLLIEVYNQIKKNKNIPDEWSEEDFEREEVKNNIRSAFRNGLRDYIVHGRLGMGTVEYFEDFGISYMEAAFHIENFLLFWKEKLKECHEKTQNNEEIEREELPTYNEMEDFFSQMAELYKDAYKDACKRIGLDDDILNSKFILSQDKIKEIETLYSK